MTSPTVTAITTTKDALFGLSFNLSLGLSDRGRTVVVLNENRVTDLVQFRFRLGLRLAVLADEVEEEAVVRGLDGRELTGERGAVCDDVSLEGCDLHGGRIEALEELLAEGLEVGVLDIDGREVGLVGALFHGVDVEERHCVLLVVLCC